MRAQNGHVARWTINQNLVLRRLLTPGPRVDVDVVGQEAQASPAPRSCGAIQHTVVLATVVAARAWNVGDVRVNTYWLKPQAQYPVF